MRRFRKWLALPAARRRLAWRALVVVGTVRLLLVTMPYQAWRRAVGLLRRLAPAFVPRGISPHDVAWAVARASAVIPGATCLTRALATSILLPSGETTATLRFGVHRSTTGDVQGHAWLETADGVLIGDDELEQYAPLGPWRAAGAVPSRSLQARRPPERSVHGAITPSRSAR